ncbi:hypothetical protein CRUP_009413 [Coryphaenoides rupestris]|nr:hypothetical protein CRUP_009413 [Coryphaenoides rupestris]
MSMWLEPSEPSEPSPREPNVKHSPPLTHKFLVDDLESGGGEAPPPPVLAYTRPLEPPGQRSDV